LTTGVWVYLSSEAVTNLRIFPFVGEKSSSMLDLLALASCQQSCRSGPAPDRAIFWGGTKIQPEKRLFSSLDDQNGPRRSFFSVLFAAVFVQWAKVSRAFRCFLAAN
jgi:hypothetical protein